jgi:nitroreductase
MEIAMDRELIEIIFKRRSVRKYQDRAVEPEKIKLLLEAGMAAPSAGNNQPWEFVVVTDKVLMDQFRTMEFANYNAPMAIVALNNPEMSSKTRYQGYWEQDVSAAVENILLAAAGLGLGAVWIGVYPKPKEIDVISGALGLPKHVVPMAMIYTGYPAEVKAPRTQYEERRVHWQQYGKHRE